MPAQLQAGDLDAEITLLRFVAGAASAYNEPTGTWAELGTMRVARIDASAAEAYRATEVAAQISMRVTVRYCALTAGVTPKDRFRFEDQDYEITACRNKGTTRRRWIEFDGVVRDDKR